MAHVFEQMFDGGSPVKMPITSTGSICCYTYTYTMSSTRPPLTVFCGGACLICSFLE